jgi:hypothetical protein
MQKRPQNVPRNPIGMPLRSNGASSGVNESMHAVSGLAAKADRRTVVVPMISQSIRPTLPALSHQQLQHSSDEGHHDH